MIDDIFEIKFKVKHGKNFIDWYRFTIPAEYRREWSDDDAIGTYKISVDIPGIMQKHSDLSEQTKEILESINAHDNNIEIQANKGTINVDYIDKIKPEFKYGNYIAVLDRYIWRKLQALFLSTFVLEKGTNEGFTVSFDGVNKTAQIIDISVDEHSDDEFYVAMRDGARLTNMSKYTQDNSKNDRQNFYKGRDECYEWKPVSELEQLKTKVGAINNVIYMLYDDNNRYFYVGKADDLTVRLQQHRKDENDIMRNFTHFRYSKVSDAHVNDIYLIENAAIHDLAAIFNMPKGVNYKGIDWETCVMGLIPGSPNVYTLQNSVEKQTK